MVWNDQHERIVSACLERLTAVKFIGISHNIAFLGVSNSVIGYSALAILPCVCGSRSIPEQRTVEEVVEPNGCKVRRVRQRFIPSRIAASRQNLL